MSQSLIAPLKLGYWNTHYYNSVVFSYNTAFENIQFNFLFNILYFLFKRTVCWPFNLDDSIMQVVLQTGNEQYSGSQGQRAIGASSWYESMICCCILVFYLGNNTYFESVFLNYIMRDNSSGIKFVSIAAPAGYTFTTQVKNTDADTRLKH